ncbi:PTS sugar transporter subunit IIB [uncultured Microbacterium sp.]|uniref:PTS sugar transporter subunit IIB n=1 Tax=uncultured Microbacterium sp. TaxID=191216 RepID=UPI0025E34DF6|nr:hypothetical protein [uncultured Microbacterium sp.]
MRIQVVCGAGASSTFVAGRLRRAALDAGRDWEITASSVDRLDPTADIVLLGSHLAERRDELAQRALRATLIVLPPELLTDLEGARLRALVEDTALKGTS